MKIQVLGTGCAKCKKLYAEAEKAVASSGVPAELEKVEKIDDIMKYGVMMTPALVIDGQVKASGRIPSVTEIVAWLLNTAPVSDTTTNTTGTSAQEAPHDNPRVRELLGTPRVVAVVGMSPKTDRASNYVARYLREQGFTTIPVNPTVPEVDGLRSYADLASIPKTPRVDLVALFVAPERTMPAVEQAASIGVKIVWFQPGEEYPASEQRARELDLEVFTGMCLKGQHERLSGGTGC